MPYVLPTQSVTIRRDKKIVLALLNSGSGNIFNYASLFMDFSNNSYRKDGATSTSFTDLSGASFSRSSAGTAQRKSSVYDSFATGVARVTDKGFLIEDGKSNACVNSAMVGAVAGNPGTAPAGWNLEIGTLNGVTCKILATGTENGLAYMDLNWSGTATINTPTGALFSPNIGSVPALTGEIWTTSLFVKLLSGSFQTANLRLRQIERSSAGAYLREDAVTLTAIAQSSRTSISRTLQHASAAYAQGGFYFTFLAGEVIDVSLRISAPQTEKHVVASSPIVTTGASAGRASDTASVPYVLSAGRTNKLAVYNANPIDLTGMTKSGDAAAILSIVDDTALLAAAGLSAICTSGKVYKLDNSLGVVRSGVSITGSAGSTVGHTVSAYLRVSGSWGLTGSDTAFIGNPGTSPDNTSYLRSSGSCVATTATTLMRINAEPGAIVHFILPQFEEGATATAPIVTTGALRTVESDDFTVYTEVEYTGDTGVRQSILNLSDGTTNNRLAIHREATGDLVVGLSVSGAYKHLGGGTRVGARTVKVAVSKSGNTWTVALDGGLSSPVTFDVPKGINSAKIGAASDGTSTRLNDYLRDIAIFPYALSAASMQNLTSSFSSELEAAIYDYWSVEHTSSMTTSGSALTAWSSVKGNYVLSQGTGASRPSFSATSMNGKPGLTFDGSDDNMAGTGTGSLPIGSEPCEIWCLVDQTAAGSVPNGKHVITYGTSSARRSIQREPVGGVNRFITEGGHPTLTPAKSQHGGDFSGRHVLRGIYSATDVEARMDGVGATLAPGTIDIGNARVRIGANTAATASGFFTGVISHIFITKPLTDTQATELQTYLKNYGGTP